ncbi:hypothetical protein [Streptomyces sp. I05A-00742]|uniref:hypothetical protein n=1 Tax=Streptomyces sp. I05A-00742 TaxID=2732853 RepID=UPI0014891973|nr:hypothetical protein [Streptomyces sp. I05A-00742]
MAVTPWEGFRYGPWPGTAVVPQAPPDEETRAGQDLPRTLLPVPGEGVDSGRCSIRPLSTTARACG